MEKYDDLVFSTIAPVKVSADTVRSYYHMEFDQSNSGIVVDDACYELMFVKEKNVNVITGDNQVIMLPPCYTLNNLKGPFKFDFPDTFSSFCIKLQPWMNASYIPTVKSQVLNLNELYNSCSDKFNETIFASTSVEEMADHAEQLILNLAIAPNKEVELIKDICNLIYERSGSISVAEIADRFNIYRQKLNQVFKQEVKYTIKTFINNIRIRNCLAYKLSNPETSFTEIAYHFGFFDQAHFVRSFKNACGVTPSEYVKKPGYSELPWEQSR